ncbi:MAG: hypothetical protein ACR5KW_02810 [Wolbachia sp.]
MIHELKARGILLREVKFDTSGAKLILNGSVKNSLLERLSFKTRKDKCR